MDFLSDIGSFVGSVAQIATPIYQQVTGLRQREPVRQPAQITPQAPTTPINQHAGTKPGMGQTVWIVLTVAALAVGALFAFRK